MKIALLGMGALVLFRVGQYVYQKRNSKEFEDDMLTNQRKQYKKLLETREQRTNTNLFNEEVFWEIVTEINTHSKGSYKNFMGLLKDKIHTFSPDDLIELDNLLNDFYNTYTTKEIVGASQIIFHSKDVNYSLVLLNYLISKNQVVFKNTCLNASLIDKLEIDELIGEVLNDFIAEAYLTKTKSLIPKLSEGEGLKFTVYQDEELPSVFPGLWMRHA